MHDAPVGEAGEVRGAFREVFTSRHVGKKRRNRSRDDHVLAGQKKICETGEGLRHGV